MPSGITGEVDDGRSSTTSTARSPRPCDGRRGEVDLPGDLDELAACVLLEQRDDGVNIGVAVAADDALIVPTVFDADKKSLGQIARDVRELAGRVRAATVRPTDLEGGTFTVSNLGMYGMSAITPVINAPQAAILGVGSLRPVLARVDGEIVDRTLMTLRLSCDHRILYGADAARFLAEIRDLLEAPLRIAL
jgi:pyruvate dehydrogenase E2 component (dihydrolipoamide acetyltransferase)